MKTAEIELLIESLVNKAPVIKQDDMGKQAYKRAIMRMALEAAFSKSN